MTHSYWGGWHHVEVHEDPWWIMRMTAMGFVYSDLLTQKMRDIGRLENELVITNPRNESETKMFRTGQHVYGSMLVSYICLSAVWSSIYLKYSELWFIIFTFRYLSILMFHLDQSMHISLPRYDPSFFFSFFETSLMFWLCVDKFAFFNLLLTEYQRMAVSLEICEI